MMPEFTIYDFPIVDTREIGGILFDERAGPDPQRGGAVTRLLCHPITGDHVAWDDASFPIHAEAIGIAADQLLKKVAYDRYVRQNFAGEAVANRRVASAFVYGQPKKK